MSKVFMMMIVASLLGLGACGSGSNGTTEVDDPAGKADGIARPLGTYRTDSPVLGEVTILVLKSDNTFIAYQNGDGVDQASFWQTGSFKFTKSGARRYIRMSYEGGDLFNRYAYTVNGDNLNLVNSDGFEYKIKHAELDASYCKVKEDCAAQGYSAQDCVGNWTCTAQNVCSFGCSGQQLVTCTLTRLAVDGMPQGPGSTSASLDPNEKDAVADCEDSLDAYLGSYSFGISVYEESLDVVFYENEHVEDEVGSMSCDLKEAVPGVPFCTEPVTIDASLGTENDEQTVHAFDFSCVLASK